MIAQAGIPTINGKRYFELLDRSHDGIHIVRSARNLEMNVLMLEGIISAAFAIVPAASTQGVFKPTVDPVWCYESPSTTSGEEKDETVELVDDDDHLQSSQEWREHRRFVCDGAM